jgi:hypothetical protein
VAPRPDGPALAKQRSRPVAGAGGPVREPVVKGRGGPAREPAVGGPVREAGVSTTAMLVGRVSSRLAGTVPSPTLGQMRPHQVEVTNGEVQYLNTAYSLVVVDQC